MNVKFKLLFQITQKLTDFMARGRRAFPSNEVGFPQDEVNVSLLKL